MPDKNFHKLSVQNNNYFITSRAPFRPIDKIPNEFIEKAFEFAYQMTFGKDGEHRDHRSGGIHIRKKGEIFANTFQGKLAEYGVFMILNRKGLGVDEPDINVFGLGVWDSADLFIKNKSVSIKSTKAFGNLLLLETKDWDDNGKYIPNNKEYDFTFLVRMNPYCEDLLKKHRLLYLNDVPKEKLREIIFAETWLFDIPGYVTRDDLVQVIQNKFIIPQGAMLNAGTQMDASNFYIQAGDFRTIEEFVEEVQ